MFDDGGPSDFPLRSQDYFGKEPCRSINADEAKVENPCNEQLENVENMGKLGHRLG